MAAFLNVTEECTEDDYVAVMDAFIELQEMRIDFGDLAFALAMQEQLGELGLTVASEMDNEQLVSLTIGRVNN